MVSIKPLISGNSKLRRAWAADLLELLGQIFVSSQPIISGKPKPRARGPRRTADLLEIDLRAIQSIFVNSKRLISGKLELRAKTADLL